MDTSLKTRILDFLGQGLSQSVVASAVGCTQGYIAQLLAEEDFRDQVTAKRTALLQQATTLDREYEVLESKLQERLKKALPFLIKPRDILDALKVVNGAKRRGSSELGDGAGVGAQVIEIRMPPTILAQFTQTQNIQYNSLNQAIQVGEQSLVTAQPTDIRRLAEQAVSGAQNDNSGKARLPEKDSSAKLSSPTEISVAALE